MSGYEVGAFEALEWTWHMLRGCKGRPGGLDDARLKIKMVRLEMGCGQEVKFREKFPQDFSPLHGGPSPNPLTCTLRAIASD